MPFYDNGLLFLTTSLVIQIYDLEHDSRCERHTVFFFSKFARNVKYCSNVAQSAKKCFRVLKMQNSAPNSKKCSKGAQRNRKRPNYHVKMPNFTFCEGRKQASKFSFSLWTWIWLIEIHLQKSSLAFDKVSDDDDDDDDELYLCVDVFSWR